jgi:hypothetical protein
MVRRRTCAVSNHDNNTCFILRDAAKKPLLKMRALMVRRRTCAVSNHEGFISGVN